jgi:hypothetical protein
LAKSPELEKQMSTLRPNDKQVLEKVFQMGDGYVLNFSDKTFREFFKEEMGIDISHEHYNQASGSKAHRMRGFWKAAEDKAVGQSIEKLLAYIKVQIVLGRLDKSNFSEELIKLAQDIAIRLTGAPAKSPEPTEIEFIAKEFGDLSTDKLGLDQDLNRILNQRIDEIRKCLNAKASLAVIFLCGSSLEGILLGVACLKVKEFNQSSVSPKDKTNKVKHFHDWTLNDFINVARDLKLVGEDVKKFSHALRDFRNYIHPYQQMSSGFDPDEHTAKICWQVLQAAITQLSKP